MTIPNSSLNQYDGARRYLHDQLDKFFNEGLEGSDPFTIYVVDQRTGGNAYAQFIPRPTKHEDTYTTRPVAKTPLQSQPRREEVAPITNGDIVDLFIALGGAREEE